MKHETIISDGPLVEARGAENVDLRTSGASKCKNSKGKVEDYESTLWKTRPFYQDDELISMLFDRYNSIHEDGCSDTISAKIISLLEQSYNCGEAIEIDELPRDTSTELFVVREQFLLEDFIINGRHMKDFKDPYELLNVDEENITFIFSGVRKDINSSMLMSAKKTVFPMRHMLKIVFESDRIFNFQVWGYFDQIGINKYSIKPLSVVYR